MISLKAKLYNYATLAGSPKVVYPLFRSKTGEERMWLVSPQHGRSFVMGTKDNRWILSKGNGLSYTQNSILKSIDQTTEIWGLLLYKDSLRDFTLGNEIASLGIKTNVMEAIIKLDFPLNLNNETINPILLQYSTESPYRISDASFMTKSQINNHVLNWKKYDKWNCDKNYKIAANILISNLRILHDNQILHNALTSQNITWALELLDFELASSPSFPYHNEDYERHVPDLFNREIIFTYQIILDIAWILNENPDYYYLDSLFNDYGFDFNREFKILQ